MHPNQKSTEPFRTKGSSTPVTSGYYPVAEPSVLSEPPELGALTSRLDPPIEIRVLSAAYPNSHTFEVWTEHTVYEFDLQLRCVAARDPKTGHKKAQSQCLGSRLLGGRRFRNQTYDLSAPLPGVGQSAVLSKDEQTTIVTSPVMRVIMYVWRWSSTATQAFDAQSEG